MKKRNSKGNRLSSQLFKRTLTDFDSREKKELCKFERLKKANEQIKIEHERVMSSLVKVINFRISYF